MLIWFESVIGFLIYDKCVINLEWFFKRIEIWVELWNGMLNFVCCSVEIWNNLYV